MTVDRLHHDLVDLSDEEGDPEEEVDVREDATVEVEHDALVEEVGRRPDPHVRRHGVGEKLLSCQRFVAGY